MKRVIIIAIMVLVTAILRANIEVISETTRQVTVNFTLNKYSIEQTDEHSYIMADGLGFTNEQGAPVLPEVIYYIAVPKDGTISVNMLQSEIKTHKLALPLMPAPAIEKKDKLNEFNWKINPELYQQTRKEAFFQIGKLQKFRYNYVIPVTISPALYRHNRLELEMAESLTLSISIIGETEHRNQVIDSFDAQENILNYQTARYWQYKDREKAIEYAPFDKSDFWYKFEITQSGIYKLTKDDLSLLPIADLDPRTIRIFTTGGKLIADEALGSGYPFKEIPLLIVGEENGIFDSDDEIIFYAENRDGFDKNESLSSTVRHHFNPYSGNGVYWLTFGGHFSTNPLRMQETSYGQHAVSRSSSPAYYHYERENVRRAHSGFDWFHSMLTGLSDTQSSFSFNISNLDASKQQTLTLTAQGDRLESGNTIYRVSMTVNGTTVFNRESWTNPNNYQTLSNKANFLKNGNNNAILTVHRTSSSTLYLDYFGIDYYQILKKESSPLHFQTDSQDKNSIVRYMIEGTAANLKAFEIKNTHQVALLPIKSASASDAHDFEVIGRGLSQYIIANNNEYLKVSNFSVVTPTDLTATNTPITAIIITPNPFYEYAEQLANLYQTHLQYNTLIVKQQDIFNQFNGGMPDPNAVRNYLLYAFYNYPSNESQSLQHVTFLGSGTIDWRNFSGQASEKNKLILFHRALDTSDDYFVDMTDNQLPDIAIGRITGQNNEQMSIIFDKITEYWNNPTPGLWRNTPLIVGDDEHTTVTTIEVVHSVQAQQVSEMLSPSLIVDKLFAIEYPFDPFGNKPKARDDMVKKINEGRLVWYYIGHGNYDLMGHESYFRPIDIQSLTNREYLPLFVAASCDVGKLDYFSYDSLSERLLVYPKGGSIASLAATGPSSPHPNHGLLSAFLKLILNDYELPGIALMKSKHQQGSSQLSNNRRYLYVGDPVLPITPPQRFNNITIEGKPDSLFAFQPVSINGAFLDNVQSQSSTVSGSHKRYSNERAMMNTTRASGKTDVFVYSSEYPLTYTVPASPEPKVINYSKWGNVYFRGQSKLNDGKYQASFIVPGDIKTGHKGRIISYFFDEGTKKDYISYYYPKKVSHIAYQNTVQDTIPPAIRLWMNNENFSDGDIVSPNPVLYAEIEDSSGINILGELGHKILLMMDADSTPIDVTDGFTYETDSYTRGKLTWQLTNLSEGTHTLQLIVFDNFNNPAAKQVSFIVNRAENIIISDLLPYPNPMSSSGSFTFKLSDYADITISIYTIRGRKIKTLKGNGTPGFNQIEWDGKDNDGSRLANNTYLYKVIAKQTSSGIVAEKIGKVIVLR